MRKQGSIVTAALALILVASGTAFAQTPRKAIISEVKGTVDVRLNGGAWQEATVGTVLHERDEIRTGAASFVKVLLDEGGQTGQIELKEKSHLHISTISLEESSGDKVTYLDLALGKVLVHAEKLHGDSKFEVRTPNASAGVRGTVFEVSVEN